MRPLLLTVLLAILTTANLMAQAESLNDSTSRPSIFDPGYAWHEAETFSFFRGPLNVRNYRYKIATDTIVFRGKSYRTVLRSTLAPGEGGFEASRLHLREEDQKVYVYNEICAREEQLLYDFTAEVGDTIPYPSLLNYPSTRMSADCAPYNAQREGPGDMRVRSIDSIQLLNGELRKRWRMEVYDLAINDWTLPKDWAPNAYVDVIEGMGSTLGLLLPYYYNRLFVHQDPDQNLYCYNRNGESLFTRRVLEDDDITCFRPNLTSLNFVGRNVTQLKLSPNPTNDRFQLDGFRATELRIYDLAGKQVRYYGREDGYTTTGLLPGMYLVRALDDKGKIAAAKLLVQ